MLNCVRLNPYSNGMLTIDYEDYFEVNECV